MSKKMLFLCFQFAKRKAEELEEGQNISSWTGGDEQEAKKRRKEREVRKFVKQHCSR